MSVSTPPLADELRPEGGLVIALVKASLGQAAGGKAVTTEVRWTKDRLSPEVLRDPTVDLFLPVESADCDKPSALTHASAVVCDHALYSEPLLQVVLGLFSLTQGSFKFDSEESILGKTVCIWRENDISALNANGRNWASYKRINVLRRASLLDCVVAVQAHDADAFAAIDLEGTHLLRKLGLAPYMTMHQRPLATRGVHAVIWRDHPRAAELLGALNEGLRRLKQSAAYASLVQHHLMAAERPPVVASAKAVEPKVAAPPILRDPPKAAVLPPSAVKEPLPPKAPQPSVATVPAPVPVPVLDPASRAAALKLLKRGDEELAEGRVAPARLLYERAAEMGLAQAAMALAGTFDATELARPHLRHIPADPTEAKRWYERAKALGAAEASSRLQRLGTSTK